MVSKNIQFKHLIQDKLFTKEAIVSIAVKINTQLSMVLDLNA
jgi:hypothetical protein